MIVRGCERKACTVEWEAVRRLSNDQIRERHADFDLVCVEAENLEGRHSELQPGDQVVMLSTGQVGGAAAELSESHAQSVPQSQLVLQRGHP